jgi:NDP-sugar pyrophosphorylase family protein
MPNLRIWRMTISRKGRPGRNHGLGLVSERGWALRNAADLIQSRMVLILNGDGYTDAALIECRLRRFSKCPLVPCE